MKIALVILHADSARGGAERYTLDLADALVKRGHDVSILASTFQSQPFLGKPVQIRTGAALTRTGRYLNFIHMVKCEVMSPARFDVVHAMLPVIGCNVYHPHAGIALDAVRSGHQNKSNVVQQSLAWMGNRFNRRRLKFAAVERKILNPDEGPAPVVLCLSNLMREIVRKQYPDLPKENLVSLFNGIDLSRFDPAVNPQARAEIRQKYSIKKDAVVALLLAQDFERKGLGPAIEALAVLDNPRVVLLVGGNPDPAPYRKLAESRGVKDRVIFAGGVADPRAFYQAADFFILPTRFDPCSLVVLEALVMGLPVISTVKNGACEIMRDGVHGRVLEDPEDVVRLSQAMRELAAYPERLAEMSQACVELRPVLSHEAHLDKLDGVYRRVIAESLGKLAVDGSSL